MQDSGRVVGAILLIAGSCIGAGMLALPVVTGIAGFYPAIVVFLIGWVFMTTTGLLLLEVNLWLGEQVSIVSMSARTLGRFGAAASWILFCFLFYLVLISYVAGSGALVADFLDDVFHVHVPAWCGSLFFTIFFGVLVYFGTRPVDLVNRVLMLGLIVSYVLLVGAGTKHVRPELLSHASWRYTIFALPVVVISFGFHNMIPSLTRYLHAHAGRLRFAVVVGSTLPLIVYLLWEWIILGIVPATGPDGFLASISRGDLATRSLREVVGGTWVAAVAQYFAFFAIITSFLAQALSLVHFLADGMHVPLTRRISAGLSLLAVLPPFVAAMIDPTIFIRALELAGAFSAVILFGIFPALMVWVGRYRDKEIVNPIVPGGRITLVTVMVFATAVIVVQVLKQIGVIGIS